VPIVPTPAGDIFYLQRGTGGPPLICIHGAGGTHAHWGYQMRDLSDTAQVYTLDLPGHGRSAPPGRSAIPDYAGVLLGFMDSMGLDRVALAGHSMGGAIALWTALEAPERIAGLGLAGTGGRLRVAPSILDGLSRDLPATIHLIVEASYAPGAPARMRERAEESYAACDPLVYQGDYLACNRFDVLARLPEIRCPTAVVCGLADRLTPPKYSEALRDAIRGATLALVPDAGHMVMIEQPDAVSNVLRSLLARL
jgi:pimeloyl-ACP methyl ester carboxylesterase